MASKPRITPENFIVFTKPEDMVSNKNRSIASSHARKISSGRRAKNVNVQTEKIVASFHIWRVGGSPAFRLRDQLGRSTNNAVSETADVRQALMAAATQKSVPASLEAHPSLQQFLNAYRLFIYPAQIILDAGSTHATSFFLLVDFKTVYQSVMGVLLTWLSTHYPSQFSVSTAIYYHSQAIRALRKRLQAKIHNDETCFSVLCAMQTDALLGDQNAYLAHQRGLECLSKSVQGALRDYCGSLRLKHDALLKKPGELPYSSQIGDVRNTAPLQYLTPPYPNRINHMVAVLPPGLRRLACQPRGMSVEMITWQAEVAGYADEVISNLSETHEHRERPVSSLYPVLSGLRSFVERLDPQSARLERCLGLAIYMNVACLYYRQISQESPKYRKLRAEVTDILLGYQPQTQAERDTLTYIFLIVLDSWKIGKRLAPEGLHLLRCLKARLPLIRQPDVIEMNLSNFLWNPLNATECKNNLESDLQQLEGC